MFHCGAFLNDKIFKFDQKTWKIPIIQEPKEQFSLHAAESIEMSL